MDDSKFRWFALLFPIAAWSLFACPVGAIAQEPPLKEVGTAVSADEGPSAALAFEKSFRDEPDDWKPIPLEECQNIQPLTEQFWSKRHVLTDFKQFRTEGQIGAIVI